MPAKENKILKLQIADLPFSKELKSVATGLNINTIEQLTKFNVTELLQQKGFTYHMLQEYLVFMSEHDLTSQVDQRK